MAKKRAPEIVSLWRDRAGDYWLEAENGEMFLVLTRGRLTSPWAAGIIPTVDVVRESFGPLTQVMP